MVRNLCTSIQFFLKKHFEMWFVGRPFIVWKLLKSVFVWLPVTVHEFLECGSELFCATAPVIFGFALSSSVIRVFTLGFNWASSFLQSPMTLWGVCRALASFWSCFKAPSWLS